jgi:hypothetical protein
VTIHGLPEYYGISDASGAYTIPYTSGVRAPYNRVAQHPLQHLCGNRKTFDVSRVKRCASHFTRFWAIGFQRPGVVSSQLAKVTTPEVGAGSICLK